MHPVVIRRGRVALITTTLLALVAAGIAIVPSVQAVPPTTTPPAPAVAGCGSQPAGAAQPASSAAKPVPPAGTGAALAIADHQTLVDPRLGTAKRVAYDGAELVIGPKAVSTPVSIGITSLTEAELPALDAGMVNVTPGPRRGYRLTPHPFRFTEPVQLSVPYDPKLVEAGAEVHTFWFDEDAGCWRPLERVAVDEKRKVVVSRTDHFTDVMNATVTAPESPEGQSFDPTSLKNIETANPAEGVNLIAPPSASNQGDARVSYPFEIPPARGASQPSVSLQYSSATENSWAGVGWDLPLPAITVDTRWGVPRFAAGLETETYQFAGEQLTPVANRTQLLPRTAEKVFHTRTEGGFARIVRHGTTPANYTWEITDKAGTRYVYGGHTDSTLTDAAGNISHWALRQIKDSNGNVTRYQSVRQIDNGVANGSVPGSNLYLQRINYTGDASTEGAYDVTFVRDRELGEPRRADVSIDARAGFKGVTADLLRRVDVTFKGSLVRRYDLQYTTGAFFKTLLKSVSQLDEDGKPFNTHTFDYHDDIRDAGGQYQAFETLPWTSPDDSVRNGAVGIVPGAGEAGAINGNRSTSAGGHLYVGWNPGFSLVARKSGSIGVKTGYSGGTDEGLVALTDVDGDSLPDKVFSTGGAVRYRQNLSKPGGAPRFGDEVKTLRNLPGILREDHDTLTVGPEAYFGGVAAQLNYVDTFTSTDRYFTDVNADGITDLVNGGSVLFGRVGPDGVPVYGVSADTPVPIGSGPVEADGLLGDYTQDRDRRTDSYPLVDSVRRWVAPFDGTVRIAGAARLLETDGGGTFAKPDGVRVAIQREDAELWAKTIAATDHTAHEPAGVETVEVQRGQRLYFRVGSRSDGSADEVAWDPAITYVGKPAETDVNGLQAHQYKASEDFTLAGRTSSLTVPTNGTLRLGGALKKKGVTTDDVTVVISRDDQPILERTLSGGETGDIPVSLDLPVQQGQRLRWRIKVDSPIDLSQLAWVPTAHYTSAEGVERLFDEDGNPLFKLQPAYDADVYPANDLTAPQGSYTATSSGSVPVQPALSFDFGGSQPDARVVVTVKRRGALLRKQVVDITDGQVPELAPMSVPVVEGNELFVDFSTSDRTLAQFLTSRSATVDGRSVPTGFHSTGEEAAFPQAYRGWGAIGYNGNRERATQPLVQTDLVVDESFRNQLPDDLDPQRDRDEFAADPRIKPPKVFTFTPAPELNRWAAGTSAELRDSTWVAAGSVRSARLGGADVGLPVAADLNEVAAVPRLSRSQQISLTGGVSGPVGSAGGSVATGDSTSELDYLDMNGDGFPDVVGANGIQYTDMTGGLGSTRGGLPNGSVRRTTNLVGNANAGSAARTITTGRGHAAPPGTGTANTSEAGNDLPPFSVGGNLGTGKSDSKFDLLDINGDGLPDRVHEDGRAALNLGYTFAPAEPWPGGVLNDGETDNSGVNIGFETDFYGFAGGASFSQGKSKSKSTLQDLNGDGLLDRVFEGAPIRVALNTGNGFAAPVEFHGSLAGINRDHTASLGGGGYFTFGPCFGAGCIVINPGANVSTGASRSEQALRDLNGDGFADHLASADDGQLTVAANRTGRTNLLKSVQRPLGASFDLEYSRDGNTYDQPASRFVLAKVSVDDGLAGDGPDTQVSAFKYSGGTYDRLERMFYGYRTVVEEHLRDGKPDRSVTRDFRTDSFYTRGLLERELTRDSQGRPFTETINTYTLRDTATGAVANPKSTTATVFPQLTRTDKRFYEGQPQATKSTRTTMEYDGFGNLTRSVDAGDVGTADDTDTRMTYPATDPACRASNILGTATAIDIRGSNGRIVRSRQATIDCATGNQTQQRAYLADDTVAVTDMTYFPNGKLRTVTQPPNQKGQRYKLSYEYDPVVGTHVASVTDSFGYRSSSTYNLKHGKVEASTDFNKQVIRYSYDKVGRVDTVTGPYEAPEHKVTIDFEYHPEAAVPYAITRNVDRDANGAVRPDTIDTITFTDGLTRVVQTKKDATVGAAPVMTVSGRVTFDHLGRIVEQRYPVTEPKGDANPAFNPAPDPVAPVTTSFDVLDRTVKVVLPDTTATTTTYGFGPDRAGATQFETVVTDAKGNKRNTFRNVREQTTATTEFNPAGDQPELWTSYGYDFIGQLVSVTDSHDNVTTTGYDNLGRRIATGSPDSGLTRTEYDLAGNAISKITANLAAQLKEVKYEYDFNRLTDVKYPLFTANNVKYSYGPPGAAKNAASRITRIDDAAGWVEREYGPLGEIVEEKRAVGHTSFTTAYKYDSWNRVLRMTYPDGEVLSYGYNSGGLVESATGVKNKDVYTYLKRLDYDKFDQKVLLEAGNGTQTQYSYDATDRRLQNLKATQPQGYAFQNLNYSYDDVGNLTEIENDTQLPGDSNEKVGGPSKQTFGYDDLYRLTSASGEYQHKPGKTDKYTYDVSYDAINNIKAKNQTHQIVLDTGHVQPQKDTTYQHQYDYNSAQPHAPSAVGPDAMRYDVNGNLVDRDLGPDHHRRQFIWDEDNRLACTQDNSKSVTLPQTPDGCVHAEVEFRYDDEGNRVVKDGHQTSLYPNQSYSTRGHHAFKHIFIGSTRLASKLVQPFHNYEDQQFYYHADHLGSTGFGTDRKGRLAEHTAYFPSGETWVSENPVQDIPYQFSGKEFDTETGLYYFGARYYDPRSSVWQSTDPAIDEYLDSKGGPGSVQLNLYAYANQNPVGNIDPDGRQVTIFFRPMPQYIPPGTGPYIAPRVIPRVQPPPRPAPQVEPPPAPMPQPRPVPPVMPGPAEPEVEQKDRPQYVYVTYTMVNPSRGLIYAGRSGGHGTPEQVVRARWLEHERDERPMSAGWLPATLDRHTVAANTNLWWWDPAYWAIRGREQQLVDFFGGARADRRPHGGFGGMIADNDIRPVGRNNLFGWTYHITSSRTFGEELHPFTGRRIIRLPGD